MPVKPASPKRPRKLTFPYYVFDAGLCSEPRLGAASLDPAAEFRFATHGVVRISSVWADILVEPKSSLED